MAVVVNLSSVEIQNGSGFFCVFLAKFSELQDNARIKAMSPHHKSLGSQALGCRHISQAAQVWQVSMSF